MHMPDVDASRADGHQASDDAVVNDYYMYVFKVQPCPKRGAHDWSSCPYAHPKEKARRRDPRVYKYASTPCPESLKGMSCGRGVDCPYAHSVYEYWLHPNRFRTQMCKKGNQCNRTLCFFAHSASELRFPDTDNAEEAAAVDAAAASATAGPLPMCQPVPCGQMAYAPGGMVMVPVVPGNSANSLPLPGGMMNLGAVCDSSSTGGSYTLLPLVGRPGQGPMRQTSLSVVSQDELSGYGLGSDQGLRMPGIAMAAPEGSSISEPLPRLGSENMGGSGAGNPTAWLQLAAASQLPASQILSSIRPPSQQQHQQGAGMQMQSQQIQMQAVAMLQQQQAAQQQAARMSAQPGGAMAYAKPKPVESSAEVLSANLAGMSLQGGLVDDSSSSSCITSLSGDQQYFAAALAAATSGPGSSYEQLAGTSPPQVAAAASKAGAAQQRADDFMLLHQLQQQQLIRLGSGSAALAQQHASGQMFPAQAAQLGGMPGASLVGQPGSGNWAVRLA